MSMDLSSNLKGARILLVEDNKFNREMALDLLQGAGMAVEVACNGREALQMLEKQGFDCVLMDCQMPVMDGFEAARLIRQREQWCYLPIIAMTARALEGDRENALAAGMNDYIAKPIEIDEMFSTLEEWVSPRGLSPAPLEPPSQEG
jgi:CheY-like chemotaxis protein